VTELASSPKKVIQENFRLPSMNSLGKYLLIGLQI
jgi:hypothetical protein